MRHGYRLGADGRQILTDRPPACLSPDQRRFHNALAERPWRSPVASLPTRQLPIVLTGGCFQNALLTARAPAAVGSRLSGVYS